MLSTKADSSCRCTTRYQIHLGILGQIVAISFATNLFFLTLLLSAPATPPLSSRALQRPTWLGPWLLNLGSILATAIPAFLLADEHYWHHSTAFMPVLLTPHIALLVLPIARVIVPYKYFGDKDVSFNDKMYSYMWALTIGSAALMMLRTTLLAWSYGGYAGIGSALMEHPAVSSVGFDVIFCWISWVCWYHTQGKDAGRVARERIDEVKDTFIEDGSGAAVMSNSFGGGVRRR
jgi:hypothetical protein